ncbi:MULTISPECIES: HDOD domain-containing protein [unclassified Colwellia]|uniref:HDOD domain-containing protein n=1 Tax=unclassified Colwellia TaxID=196834 RepID=UPI0015F59130|nr:MULTISPECIES: HDOD domain-containing protein [unclassified Colwellia]MBA6230790.1 HDOD domain-containing protein [Colwellia sp. MB02u-7]MBA6234721.1 HDOD domain-containing protein [Colwellia sp. MB02u-11]MBA6301276.1 HDOD domain-containing protein [Colwellia sp. MB3u-22]MBA6312989.1 HDOD domain-containing protein [Colwellia sp. MB3u-64]
MGAENALYTILVEKIKQDALVLPTLPEIALKVREAADNPDINLNQMSDIIGHDPALSMGMLKVANSVILGRSVKVETVNQAVTRIGLRQIKSIATAMALEQVFVSKNKIVSMYLKQSWEKTIDVASVAISLMTFYIQGHKHTSLTLDTLTLAALVHNVGVLPILTEAEKHPDVFANPTFLKQAIAKLSGDIGGEVTKAWGFSNDFITLVTSWGDLTVLPAEAHYLDFIRVGAIYHGIFKNESTCEVLLKSYVNKGILSDVNFMESEEFQKMVTDVKAMFS